MEAMPSTESTRLSPMYVGQVGRVDNKMTESRGVTVEAKMREKKKTFNHHHTTRRSPGPCWLVTTVRTMGAFLGAFGLLKMSMASSMLLGRFF